MEEKSSNYLPDVEFWLSNAPLSDGVEEAATAEEEVSLLELLDSLLTKGVVLSGDITLSVAGVDLLYIGLRLLITTADKAVEVGAVQLKNGRIV